MKRVAILTGCLFVLAFVAGCSGGTSDVSEGSATDKYDQMKKATEATVDQDVIDKTKN